MESKIQELNFLRHDWFQKGINQIMVHLYVKNVNSCSADFKEDCISVQFQTSNEQFLKIHGPNTDNEITFSYSISTSGKIIPDLCSCTFSTTRIDLRITKAIPNHWVSLETKKAVIDRKKVCDVAKELSGVSCSVPENSGQSIVDKPLLGDPVDNSLKDKQKEEFSTSSFNGYHFKRSCRSPENMALLGGKSTPVSKTKEPENKVEKEPAVPSEPQASAVVRDSSSLKSMNKVTAAGLTGLWNYANNCYLNVVIQVLANIPEIRDHFINDHFVNSLNVNNPLGSGGHVARAFSDVIKALWSGRKRPVWPTDLKNIMGKRCSAFYGSQQCDAQEFFSTLLDNLHEDMNHGARTDRSIEGTHKESDGPSVNEKPDTAWSEHVKRNNSLIIKMFHGQMVSKLTCLECHKRSTVYEVCAQISLPIAMSRFRPQVTVFFRDHTRLPERLRLQISSPNAQIWHLLNSLERYIGIPAHCLRVCHDNKGSFYPAFNDDTPLSYIRNMKQVIVCEIKDEKDADFISLPFRQSTWNPSKLNQCSSCAKSQNDIEAKLKRCTRCMSVAYCSRDCQAKHWSDHQQDCRKGFKAPVGLPFYVTMRRHKLSYETLAAEVMHYANFSVDVAEKEAENSDGELDEKRPAKVDTASNFATKQPEKFSRLSSVSDCDQAGKKHMEGALSGGEKNVDNNAKLREVEKDEKQRRLEGASNTCANLRDDFIIKAYLKPEQDGILINSDDFKLEEIAAAAFLAIEWRKDFIKERDSKELNTPFKMVQGCLSDDGYGDRCSIRDCFSMFLEAEKLTEKEGWKCPRCKTVQAVKKEMALSYPPPILLVHFKRFTYGSYGQKVAKGINYPTSGLDLSHYITEETRNMLTNCPIYDLFGVICHNGSMGIGHYTCMVQCLNQQGQPDIGWRYFDDDFVSKIDEDKVCDSSAYVLVYRMRGMAHALKSECPFVLSSLQVNESGSERSRATARGPIRQASSESETDAGNKTQYTGVVRSNTKQTDRKPEADHKDTRTFLSPNTGIGVQDRNLSLDDNSGPGLSDEDFSEDSFEMANDCEFVYTEHSEQEKIPTKDSRISDVCEDNPDEDFSGPSHNQSSSEARKSSADHVKASLSKESHEHEEEQFYLARSAIQSLNIADLTEDDLD